MIHSVKVTRKNSQSDGFIQPQQLLHPSPLPSPSPLYSTPSPISYNYFDYNSDIQSKSRSLSLTDSDHSLFSHISDQNLPKKDVPNMKDFLEGLDKEFGNSKFTYYLSVFKE